MNAATSIAIIERERETLIHLRLDGIDMFEPIKKAVNRIVHQRYSEWCPIDKKK